MPLPEARARTPAIPPTWVGFVYVVFVIDAHVVDITNPLLLRDYFSLFKIRTRLDSDRFSRFRSRPRPAPRSPVESVSPSVSVRATRGGSRGGGGGR